MTTAEAARPAGPGVGAAAASEAGAPISGVFTANVIVAEAAAAVGEEPVVVAALLTAVPAFTIPTAASTPSKGPESELTTIATIAWAACKGAL